jgi:ferrochelatase
MSDTSPYVQQLNETCSAIAGRLRLTDWNLVYQSRSGPPAQRWLEPDILEHIRSLDRKELVIAPVGFISDHMEVLYDLDTEAAGLCKELGIRMVRAGTVGTHPAFVQMILDLAGERRTCEADCCAPPARPTRGSGSA